MSNEAPVPVRNAKLRVLLVEDNLDAAEPIKIVFQMLGHKVWLAHDGPSALALIEAAEPDLALVDIGLPGMDGYELVRRLRDLPRMGKATLVALTGWGREEDKQRARGAGFHLHLTKPVDLHCLQALISETRARRVQADTDRRK